MNFRQEIVVSKAVEFKFLKKLLILLGIEEIKHPLSASATAAIAMETDTDLDLEQCLKSLMAFEDSEESGAKQRSILNALVKCLELVWKYDIYQVC